MEINKCSEEEARKEMERIAEDNQITGNDIDWTNMDQENLEEEDESEDQKKKNPIGFRGGDET